jgi:hypothetical protein
MLKTAIIARNQSYHRETNYATLLRITGTAMNELISACIFASFLRKYNQHKFKLTERRCNQIHASRFLQRKITTDRQHS